LPGADSVLCLSLSVSERERERHHSAGRVT
jgi:hypothetical protein